MTRITRRRFLAGTGLVGAAAFGNLSSSAKAALAMVAPATASLNDIEHFVILCQENRSFDHYFGTLAGVRGFGDPMVQPDPITGRTVFEQVDPNLADGAGGVLLPWRVDPSATAGQCMADVDHSWQGQHVSIGNDDNSLFATVHSVADLVSDPDVTIGGIRAMSYFTRAELPFHYGLADAFTVCDHYFCSALGPTIPNRLYLMTGMLDPDGTHGGPEVNNLKYPNHSFTWTTYPERLQAAGIDWWVYREQDDFDDNVLADFVQYQDTTTDLYRRARSTIDAGQLPAKLRDDVVNGKLPQVSWIVGAMRTTEHPDAMPAEGALYIQHILEALTADPSVWAKTALIITYDENGGFFDHVVPPMPPPGTPGEFLTPSGLAAAPEASGIAGPIGLGFRVPTLVVSPFSRGGYVCSDVFDHTSTLRLLEARYGVEVPYLTDWRRATVGDLTSTFSFGCAPDLSVPDLVDAQQLYDAAVAQCSSLPQPKLPTPQHLPTQEPGTRPNVNVCATTAAADANAAAANGQSGSGGVLPATGRSLPLTTIGVAAAAAVGLRRLRDRARDDQRGEHRVRA